VYRGATPRTRVGADLIAADLAAGQHCDRRRLTARGVCALPKAAPTDSERVGRLLAAGVLLDGLPLFIERRDGALRVLRDDLGEAPQCLTDFLESRFAELRAVLPSDCLLYGRLIGMRGKERRTLRELVRRITENAGPVRSAKFMALTLVDAADKERGAQEVEREREFLRQIVRQSQFLGVIPSVENPAAAGGASEALYLTDDDECVIVRRPRFVELTMIGNSEGVGGVSLEDSGESCGADVAVESGLAALVRADECLVDDRFVLRNAHVVTPLYDLVGSETLAVSFAPQAEAGDVRSAVAGDHIVVTDGQGVTLSAGAACTVRDCMGKRFAGRAITLYDGDVTRAAIFLSGEVAA
ncbi:MAG TPA: hypothetical protein VLB27_05295, partial [candidate division Zixibacteria bacterium]|nr:hypothetical protein [candidate division Zixibacteria bacterium]